MTPRPDPDETFPTFAAFLRDADPAACSWYEAAPSTRDVRMAIAAWQMQTVWDLIQIARRFTPETVPDTAWLLNSLLHGRADMLRRRDSMDFVGLLEKHLRRPRPDDAMPDDGDPTPPGEWTPMTHAGEGRPHERAGEQLRARGVGANPRQAG